MHLKYLLHPLAKGYGCLFEFNISLRQCEITTHNRDLKELKKMGHRCIKS